MDQKSDVKVEVSFVEFETKEGTLFKVTRRIPGFMVAETKIFKSKEEAKKLFEYWLDKS